MAHPYHMHREHQVSHRRINPILKEEPAGAKQHAHSPAFSKVTSKTAAEHHDAKVKGNRHKDKYARGGKVKKGHQTNVNIVMPQHRPPMNSMPGGPPAGPPMAPPPPMGGPGLPPGGPPGAGGPPMPMRASGGRIKNSKYIGGESSEANIKSWGKRAGKNSYFRGGAATGVGREEKAEHMKRRRGK